MPRRGSRLVSANEESQSGAEAEAVWHNPHGDNISKTDGQLLAIFLWIHDFRIRIGEFLDCKITCAPVVPEFRSVEQDSTSAFQISCETSTWFFIYVIDGNTVYKISGYYSQEANMALVLKSVVRQKEICVSTYNI